MLTIRIIDLKYETNFKRVKMLGKINVLTLYLKKNFTRSFRTFFFIPINPSFSLFFDSLYFPLVEIQKQSHRTSKKLF